MNITRTYADAALTIARKICRDAIWDGERCNWIASASEGIKTYFRSLSPEFYAGTAGIAYFLGAAYHQEEDPVIRRTAYGAIRQALSASARIPQNALGSFYTGLIGLIYTLAQLSRWLADPGLLDLAVQMTREYAQKHRDGETAGIDVIDGAAGAIPVLLELYEKENEPIFLELATNMGHHLHSQKVSEAHGSSWKTLDHQAPNLTGFAHGAAGISHALLLLFKSTGQEQFRIVAEEAIRYENAHFDPIAQNWPDFRESRIDSAGARSHPCAVAWCHGAPGIGLARLSAYTITNNPAYLDDVKKAIDTTLRHLTLNQLGNFSLCHGLFGNAELLLEASLLPREADPVWMEAVEKITRLAIAEYLDEDLPLPNGVHTPYDNPELMTGVAGMGYFLLRLHDPVSFPSILLFRPQALHGVGSRRPDGMIAHCR